METLSLQEVEKAIRAQEEQLYRAMAASDVAELDALIDDGLRFVGPDGRLATKQADLEAHRNGAVVFTKFEPKALEVKPFDGFALAYATLFLEGTALGQPFGGEFQYTRVWVLREEEWRIVGGSVTPVH